jgi:hypothetical protein
MFFDRPDFDLASAKLGTFAIKPNPNMLDSLRRDYANTASMIFGAAPTFEEIMASIDEIDAAAPDSGEIRWSCLAPRACVDKK